MKLRQPGAHREIGTPQQSSRAQHGDRLVEHAAIDSASREIRIDVRTIDDRGERVHVVAAAADVREDERRARMSRRESGEIRAIRDLL